MLKNLIKLANHLDQKGLAKEADYLDNIIKKLAEDDNIICESANSLELCASYIKKEVLRADPDREEISLADLNDMFDFYEIQDSRHIRVVKKNADHKLKDPNKFELSADKNHHNSLNYHPFGMVTKPIVKK